MKNFMKEFKEFITRGNVLDMAIGVIIATAFGKITSSLVNDVFMPLISYIFKSPNTTALNFTLVPEVTDAATGEVTQQAVVLGLGTFIGTIVDFVIIALIVFCIVKAFNKARQLTEKKKEEEEAAKPAEPAKPTTEELLTEILEEIKKK